MIAKEIIDIESKLRTESSTYFNHCQEIAELMLPGQDIFFESRLQEGEKRGQKIISSLAQQAVYKCATGKESVVTPRSSRWHHLTTGDEVLDKDQETSEYLEAVVKLLFKTRYDSRSRFASQMFECYISLTCFGAFVMETEEDGANGSVRYRSSHVSEHSYMVNDFGTIDTNYRKYKLTARQAEMKFGRDNLPPAIIKALDKEPNLKFDFIHCVMPNTERKEGLKNYKSFKYASYHICLEGTKLLSEGGFRTFPYHIARDITVPGDRLPRSLAMMALPEVKQVNAMRKTALKAGHLAVSPPILTASEAHLRRPNMKPDGVNYGALDVNGNQLIKPFINGSRMDVSNDQLEQSYTIINDIFMVTLFQILIDSPTKTATQVLQEAQEKGELLSPSGSRVQETLGGMIEREIDILNYADKLPPMPQKLIDAGGKYDISYTAPLNIMQRAGEAAAATQIINDSVPLFELDPTLRHKIDFGEYVNIMREARNAPARLFRSDKEVDALVAQEQQQQQMSQMVEAAPNIAGSIKDIAQAEASLR